MQLVRCRITLFATLGWKNPESEDVRAGVLPPARTDHAAAMEVPRTWLCISYQVPLRTRFGERLSLLHTLSEHSSSASCFTWHGWRPEIQINNTPLS